MHQNIENKYEHEIIHIKPILQNSGAEINEHSNLLLYSNPHSRGNTVLWMLNECRANYNLQYLHFSTETKSEQFRAINPLGKLPTLVHNDRIITETGAICAYLAELYPSKNLKPTIDSPYLADYYRWLFFISGTFDNAIIAKATNSLPNGRAAGMSSVGRFEDIEMVVEQALKKTSRYLCGDQFTVADLLFSSYLLFATKQISVIALTPLIEQYLEPILSRQAFLDMLSMVNNHSAHFKPYADS
ncbi:glutathione S-transferase family protein [Thorsellia anophelis]|uniref:Glutathione S-transferase n=1 Tax=Thorsellia anophelis DSM 18579 TaxID=1123402 RepID=A0A1I0CVC7_9GAMM|nr:glutathione S-transferase family protein [Thorsellia anophelis]SET23578.1 glutathione S-transferase [Thorsellia anophelis DSM 18579]